MCSRTRNHDMSFGAIPIAMVVAALSSACTDRPALPDPSPPSAGQLSNNRAPAAQEVATAIEAHVDGREPVPPIFAPAERAELRSLYRAGGFAPLWVDRAGAPGSNARDVVALLAAAGDDGLDPADYHVDQLRGLMAPQAAKSPSAADVARLDVALSAASLRYLRHLHAGRVDPRAIGLRLRAPAARRDLAALLLSAIAEHTIVETAASLRPSPAQYRWLRAGLARYRALAADPTLQSPLPAATVVRPGDLYDGAGQLRRLLMAAGDLPPDAPVPADGSRYDGTLVDGVKRFQVNHGLEPDGVIGKDTFAALRTPFAWRVRQIELALERLRWLPQLGDERLIVLNIPMFRLWAWDTTPATGAPSFSMNTIVGRALGTQTPVFMAEMSEVVFKPYWNIPRSILLAEVLPRIERDAAYLEREDMEIVRGPGDDARAVEFTPAALAELRQGRLRVRQRPGPRNALGLIKLVFPNEEHVYMHGTPAQALFARSRRDFSHGCVRVEDAAALAEWALQGTPGWNRERITSATEAPRSLYVKLARPVHVILFYTTAMAMPGDGTIRFAPDIYGQDVTLDRALRRE